MSRRILDFPRRETQDVSLPLSAKPGDQFMLVELSDDAFSGALGKGAKVLIAKGRMGNRGLMAVQTTDARLLVRYLDVNPDGILTVTCHNYPTRHYAPGEYEIIGSAVQCYERDRTDGCWWELVRDEDIRESQYVRPLLRLPG